MNLGEKIYTLRKEAGYTQKQLADLLGVQPTTISNYEKNTSQPSLSLLITLSKELGVSTDYLLGVSDSKAEKALDLTVVKGDITLSKEVEHAEDYITGKTIRPLPIVIDKHNRENIPLVTTKAAAGYLELLDKPEYIGNLPAFSLPMPEFRNGTYRCFPVQGESMTPELMPGSYVIGKYVENWISDIKDDQVYIVVHTGDLRPVIKRVKNRIRLYEKLALISDNPDYPTYSIEIQDVKEVWRFVAKLSFTINKTKNQMLSEINSLKTEMAFLRERMDRIDKSSDLLL